MISRIRQKLGPAGFILAIVALVAALGGGAYAASGGLTGKQKKEVEKIAKKVAGAPGAPGSPGAPGAIGPAGAAGAAGKNGTNGTNGKSVELGTPTPEECEFGGTTVQVAGEPPATKTPVCNGETGFTETLPSGAEETGTWWVIGNSEEKEEFFPISFPIPLSEADAAAITVHFWKEFLEPEKRDKACKGTPNAPKAEPGTICFYFPKASGEGPSGHLPEVHRPDFVTEGAQGVGTSGAILKISETSASAHSGGSFAITAP